MTDDQSDYRQNLQEDLARHRNQQRIPLSLPYRTAGDEQPLPPAVRLYNRLRRSEPSVRLDPRPPEDPKPPSFYHQRTFYQRAVQSQQIRRSNDHADHMDTICSEAPFPANMLESYRNRDCERRIEANLSPVRPQQREVYMKLQDELAARSGSLNSIAFEDNRLNPMQGLSELCENEQRFYDEIFKKLIDSEATRCKESGDVLRQIRRSYQEMFLAIPHYIKKAQECTQHVDSIVSQLEHQTELNRELQARMSLLESGQERVQLERESWHEEKTKIMENQTEFQNNFLQLRNFWESERNRYEQELKQLKSNLQETGPHQYSKPPDLNAFGERLESIMSSVIDLIETAPEFGDCEDVQTETENIHAGNEAYDSQDSDNPSTEPVSMPDRIALPLVIQHPFCIEEKEFSSQYTFSDPLIVQKEVPLISNPQSSSQDCNVNGLTNETVSIIQDTIFHLEFNKDGLLRSDSAFIDESSDDSARSTLDDHMDVSKSVHSNQESHSNINQKAEFEVDSLELLQNQSSHNDVIDNLSDPLFSQICEESEPLNPNERDGPPQIFIEKDEQVQMLYQKGEDEGSKSPNPSDTSEEKQDEQSKTEEIILKPTERPPPADTSQFIMNSDFSEKTFSRINFQSKFEKTFRLDKNQVEHIQKERQADLDFIENFGSSSSLPPRSLLSSRLSNWSSPGWHDGSKPTFVIQSSRQRSPTRVSARSTGNQNLSCKPNLRASLENLLTRAEHHRSTQTTTETNLLKLINFILDSCYAATIAKKEKYRKRVFAIELKLYTIGLMKEQHGLDEIVIAKWCEMINSVRKYRVTNAFVELFDDLLETESELHVHILLRIRQILAKSRCGIVILMQEKQFICQDRAMDVIKSLFSDFASTSSYKTTTALISQGCRRWAHIVHDSGSVDAIRKSQILSPRLNLTLMDVINPNDKRFNCHEFGIDISRFVSLAYVGIRRAELEYERDQWARQVFQSVDSNNDHFISFEQFSRAFSTNTIPQIPMRQLRVLFDRMTQEASTQQMSLDRFRQVCCQLTHVMFVNNVADDDSDDHLRPAVERIIEKWTRLDPAYNKFIELMCSTESGFDICQRLSYARLKFEGALIYGSTSQKVIEKYCTMLGIIAEQQQDKSVFRSSSSLINDINRLEQSVDQRLVALMGPGSTKSS